MIAAVFEKLEVARQFFEEVEETEKEPLFTNLNFGEAVLISVICMVIVFAMLALLWGLVSLFKYIPTKKAKEEAPKEEAPAALQQTESIKFEDIKDEDMMVAALVASIDYHNEIKKDVRVVSVKEL